MSKDRMTLPFTAIPNILVRERFLTTTEKLILFYIASMGATGLTIGTKALRERLAPLGNTGLLRSIKRLLFLGMIRIEQVQKKKGEPAYKKLCHRYFFVKDPMQWLHTVDFRIKIKAEMERMQKSPSLNFKTDVFLDEKHLDDAFSEWLASTRPTAFHEKPKKLATSPNAEAKKWIAKIEKLKNGHLTFLKIAEDAIFYASYLDSLTEESTVCREKLQYMNLIFESYEDAYQNPKDEQTRDDIEWIEKLKSENMVSEEISRLLSLESIRRKDEEPKV